MPDYSTALYLMLGIILIGSIITYRTLNGKITRPDFSGDRVVFRTPHGLIVAMTMFLLLPALLGLWVLPSQIASLRTEQDSLIVTVGWSAAFAAFFVVLPLAFVALLLGMLPGPQELRLDKKQRTYDLRFGTFLKRRFRSGSWGDIEGVFVRPIRVKESVSYGIYISWRQGLSGGPSLGLAGQRDQAERLAERIAQELGLQVVNRRQTR